MLNGLLKKILGKGGSKQIAKKRLQFALIYDKLEVSDTTLQSLQRDIVEVISRYFVIDQEEIKLEFQRDQDSSALVVNTPILSARRTVTPA